METVRFNVKGKYDLDLACVKVLPKREPKAVIQIFHGMGEYKDRYLPFMEYLADNGFAVYAHDHRKHGESLYEDGTYGMFTKEDTWDDVIDDCYFVSRRILKEHPGKSIYTLGHSMGSIINRLFIAKYNTVPKGAIIMGTLPPFKLSGALAPIMLAGVLNLFAGKKRSKFMADLLNKPMLKDYDEPRTDLEWLSRDDEIVDKYIEDELCGYAYTPKFYSEFFKGILESNKSDLISETKDIPMLFISGDADPVGNNGAGVEEVVRIFNGHGYNQLTLELIPDARHEVLNEINSLSTFEFIKNWLVSIM